MTTYTNVISLSSSDNSFTIRRQSSIQNIISKEERDKVISDNGQLLPGQINVNVPINPYNIYFFEIKNPESFDYLRYKIKSDINSYALDGDLSTIDINLSKKPAFIKPEKTKGNEIDFIMKKMKNKITCTATHKLFVSNNDNKLFIRLNWHNAMFFGHIAKSKSSDKTKSFICKLHEFRKKYIDYIKNQISYTNNVQIIQVGSDSCVSDIDLSISLKIVDIETRLSNIVDDIINVFRLMYNEHYKHFDDSFEDMFDTNIYATSFILNMPFSFRHALMKTVQTFSFLDISKLNIEEFSKLQTIFACRRICNYHLNTANLPDCNIKNIINRILWNNKKALDDNFSNIITYINKHIKDTQSVTLSFMDLKKYYTYDIFSFKDSKIKNDYTYLIKAYYNLMDSVIFEGNNDNIYLIPCILSCATMIEQDSYHSMGAFLDIVAFTGRNDEYMPHECMFTHSILDNIGFIIDILNKHSSDGCYDIITNILKISKYIERICKSIEYKNIKSQNSITRKIIEQLGNNGETDFFPLKYIKESAKIANKTRKEPSSSQEEKDKMALNLIRTLYNNVRNNHFESRLNDNLLNSLDITMHLHHYYKDIIELICIVFHKYIDDVII